VPHRAVAAIVGHLDQADLQQPQLRAALEDSDEATNPCWRHRLEHPCWLLRRGPHGDAGRHAHRDINRAQSDVIAAHGNINPAQGDVIRAG
jgi:hypothetical protein